MPVPAAQLDDDPTRTRNTGTVRLRDGPTSPDKPGTPPPPRCSDPARAGLLGVQTSNVTRPRLSDASDRAWPNSVAAASASGSDAALALATR